MFPGLRKVLGLYHGYRLHLAASQALMIGAVVCMLLIQTLNARLIDQGIQVRDIEVVVQTAVAMIAIAAVGGILFALNAAYAVLFSEHTAHFARDTVFRQIETLSFGNIDRFRTSALLVRLSSDVENLRTAVLYGVMFLLPAPISIVVAVLLGLITAPSLAPIMIGVLVILAIVLALILGGIQPLYDRRQGRLDAVNGVLQEQLAGVRVVKAFVREDYERQRFAGAAEDLRQAALTPALRIALFMPTINFVIYAGIALLYWFGGRTVIEGTGLAVGDIVAFAGYLTAAVIPMALLAFLLPMLTQGEASVSRLLEVLDAEPEVRDRPHPTAVDVSSIRGRIAFEHVSFGYQGDDGLPATLVLRDIDFVAEPGETIGFLGATGSGKTSLVNLVPRFYDVVEGRVTLDGVDVRDIPQHDLRDIVGDGAPGGDPLHRRHPRQHHPGSANRRRRDGGAAGAADAAGFVDVLPGGTTAPSRAAATTSPAASGSASRSPVRSPAPPGSSSSTTARARSTSPQRGGSRRASADLMGDVTRLYVAQRISAVLTADRIVAPRRRATGRGRIARRAPSDVPALPRDLRIAARTGGRPAGDGRGVASAAPPGGPPRPHPGRATSGRTPRRSRRRDGARPMTVTVPTPITAPPPDGRPVDRKSRSLGADAGTPPAPRDRRSSPRCSACSATRPPAAARFVLAIVLILVDRIVGTFRPLIIGAMAGILAAGGPLDELQTLVVILAALSLFMWVEGAFLERTVAHVAQDALYRLRSDLVDRIQGLSLNFYDRRPIGELMSGVTNDSEAVSQFLSNGFSSALSSIVQIVTTLIAMVLLSVPLTLVTLAVIPIVVFATYGAIERIAGPAFAQLQEKFGGISGFQEETLSGEKTIIAYNRQDLAAEIHADVQRRAPRRSAARAQFTGLMAYPVSQFVAASRSRSSGSIGGVLVIEGQTSPSPSSSPSSATAGRLSEPISQLGQIFATALKASPAPRGSSRSSTRSPRWSTGRTRSTLPEIEGRVVFDHVDFSYVPGRRILHDNSFVAEAGQKIGLVGPTGAGKSTILNVLTRYYDIDAGSITIDGHEVRGARPRQPDGDRWARSCRSPSSSPTRSWTT